jgi:hypothetical protein
MLIAKHRTRVKIEEGATMQADRGDIAETILALEQSLNERWSRGDCHGYLDTYSDNMSYFDPLTAKLLV